MGRPSALLAALALPFVFGAASRAWAFQEESLMGPADKKDHAKAAFQAVPERPADTLPKEEANAAPTADAPTPARPRTTPATLSSTRSYEKRARSPRDFLGPWDVGFGVGITQDDFNGGLGIAYNVDQWVSARLDHGYRSNRFREGREARAASVLAGRAQWLNPTIFVPYAEMGPGYETFRYTNGNALHHEGYSATLHAAVGLELRFTPYFALAFQRQNTTYLNSTDRQAEDGDWDRRAARNDVTFRFVL